MYLLIKYVILQLPIKITIIIGILLHQCYARIYLHYYLVIGKNDDTFGLHFIKMCVSAKFTASIAAATAEFSYHLAT